jgi:hypothetical protein
MLRSGHSTTLPPRSRSPPTLPDRRSEYLSIHSDCCFGLTSQCSALVVQAPPGSREIPSASAALLRGPAGRARNRRGHPAPLACRHADGVPACSPRSTGDPVKPDTAEANRSSPRPITSSSWRLRRRIAVTNRSSATAGWTQPNSHMESDAMTLPPSFRREIRNSAWEMRWTPSYTPCLGSGRAEVLTSRLPSAVSSGRTGGGYLWSPPSVSSLPTEQGRLTIGESAAMGRAEGEPPTSASIRGTGFSTVLALTPGGCPSSQRLLSILPVTVASVGRTSVALPSATTQTRDKLVAARSNGPPPRTAGAASPTRGAKPRPSSAVPTESARVASDPHRTLDATGRHKSLPTLDTRRSARRSFDTDASDGTDRRRRFEPRETLPGSQRPRTRDAICAVRALTPTDRIAGVATSMTRHHRWMETTIRRSAQLWYPAPHQKAHCGDVSTFRSSMLWTTSARPHPKVKRDWRSPCRPLESGTRPEPVLSSSGQAAWRCRHLQAIHALIPASSHPGPRSVSRDGGPKTTFTCSTTRLWVDTCLPPCGSAQTPAPTLSSTRGNSTEGLLTVISNRRCRRPKRLGAKPETVGGAPTANRALQPRLATKPPRALAAGCTRGTDGSRRPVSEALGTSCAENPALERYAR